MDNTAAPVICKPIEHGAAVVVYSLTKYIAGHGTVVGGALIDGGNFDWTADPKRQPLFNEPDASYGGVVWGKAVPELTGANVAFAVRARVTLLRDLGSALSPDNAFGVIQGLETVALRMKQHCDNAAKVVDYLKNPLTYDGLESIAEVHPSIKSADIYPRMQSITDEDLFSIAGHIMLQPKIVTEKWGGGKIYY